MNTKEKTHFTKAGLLRFVAIGGLSSLTLFAFYQQAQAGPITGGAGNAPYVKLGVYQGLISIVPGGATDSIMEIGNAGRDIKTTGDLNLYPAVGSNVHVLNGGLCFGSGTGDCRNSWTGGGSVGPGTVNRVPKFTAASVIGDSAISETNGNVQITGANANFGVQSASGDYPIDMRFQAGGVAQPWRFIFPSSVNGGGLGAGANNFGIYNATAAEYLAVFRTNATVKLGFGTGLNILANGNVGIGNTTPNEKLEVTGNIRINNNYLYGRHDAVGTVVRTSRTDNTQAGLFRSNGWGDFTYDRSVGIGYDLAGASAGVGNLLVAGKTGIGTTSPGAKLTVNNPTTGGKVGAAGDAIYAYANSSNAAISGEQGDTSGYAGYFSGNVGITSSSTTLDTLSVVNNGAGNALSALYASNASLNGYAGYFAGQILVSSGITLGNVRKTSWPIQVCAVNGGACLGKYIATVGSTTADLRYVYNNASNQPTQSNLIYSSVPNSCPNGYSLVARSTGSASYYLGASCSGTEFINTGGQPYGTGNACVEDGDDVLISASRRNSIGCSAIVQTVNRAKAVIAPSTITTLQYELR